MITNYPKVLKYAIGDSAFIYKTRTETHDFGYPDGFIGEELGNARLRGQMRHVIIQGWKTVVTSIDNMPVQNDFYTFKEVLGYESIIYPLYPDFPIPILSDDEYELPAHKLFSSQNHVLTAIKGNYINSAFGDLEENGNLYFAKMGNPGGILNTNGDWIDWAGMNFKDMDFAEVQYNNTWVSGFVGSEPSGTKTLILDDANLEGAILPSEFTLRQALRNSIFSYDAETTIFKDGLPMGRSVTGTVAGSISGNTVTGTSTTFTTQLSVGDRIVIGSTGVFTITAIASNTSLTVAETFADNFTGKTISRI